MGFRVLLTGDNKPLEYSDARFEIKDGVLVIHYDDKAKWSEFFSPHAWRQVTAPPDTPSVWFLNT